MLPIVVDIVEGVIGGLTNAVKVVFGNKEARDQQVHEETIQETDSQAKEHTKILDTYIAEFGDKSNRTLWDSFVDGLNRLVRPLCTFGTLAMFIWACIDPVNFTLSMQAIALIPDFLWAIFAGILAFWFGERAYFKGANKPGMQEIKDAIAVAKEIAIQKVPDNTVLEIAHVELPKEVENMSLPRGIRNNNPGNIRLGADWKGLVHNPNEKSFCTFSSPAYGIRALTVVIRNYGRKYGLYNIEDIIARWAPPNENDTEAYINAVCKSSNYGRDTRIDLENDHAIFPIVKAIIRHENGQQPYSDDTIREGIALA